MRPLAAGLFALLLAACASRPPAPVEDMSSVAGPGAPRGYYRVNTGDTLYAIAFGRGLDFRELAAWNGLRSPYTIYPGQNLRLTPPPGGTRQAVRTKKPATTQPKPSTPKAAPASTAPDRKAPSKPAAAPATPPDSGGPPARWLWPAEGRIIRGFSPTDPSRDGIDIAGREGDPVKASAAGTVVYSGSGLIGYGELVIVKHDERWLSAYGHNRRRLVAEGDAVQAGQHIADMGRNDRNEQVLHFEIRSNGRPVNPLDHLPSR